MSLDLKRGEVSGNVLTGVSETQMRAVKCHRALQGMLEHRVIQQNKKNKKRNKSLSKHRLFGRAVMPLTTGPWKTEESTSMSTSTMQNWECSKYVLHLSFIRNIDENYIYCSMCWEQRTEIAFSFWKPAECSFCSTSQRRKKPFSLPINGQEFHQCMGYHRETFLFIAISKDLPRQGPLLSPRVAFPSC